jgi:hypothetical protein
MYIVMNENKKFTSHMCHKAFKVPSISTSFRWLKIRRPAIVQMYFTQKKVYFFEVDNVHKFEKKCLKGHIEPQWAFHDFLK